MLLERKRRLCTSFTNTSKHKTKHNHEYNSVSRNHVVDLHLVEDWLNEALNPFKRPYESEWNLMDSLLPLDTMGSGDVIQYLKKKTIKKILKINTLPEKKVGQE